jgi:hypothetical protein
LEGRDVSILNISFVHKGLCPVCSVLRETEFVRTRGVQSLGGAFGARCAHRCRFPPYMLGLDPVFPWAAMSQGRVIGEAYQRSARTLDHRVPACERERKGHERREYENMRRGESQRMFTPPSCFLPRRWWQAAGQF